MDEHCLDSVDYARRKIALESALDRVIEAAKAWEDPPPGPARKYCEDDLSAAVRALRELEERC